MALIEAALRKTCSACPAQWEGKLSDGRWLYARYRHGFFQAAAGRTLDAAIDATVGGSIDPLLSSSGGELLLERSFERGDGHMETEEMRGLLAEVGIAAREEVEADR